jgi:hypothetical protein
MHHIHVYTEAMKWVHKWLHKVRLQNLDHVDFHWPSCIHLINSAMAPSLPKTPRKWPKTLPRTLGTPWRCKFPLSIHLQGIKLADLLFTQIKEKLIDELKLLFASDEWQLHLVSQIHQGYDSIFFVGTGQFQHMLILTRWVTECHECHNLWLSAHLRCWTTTTSPGCCKSAMRVANTNVFDLQANFNDKIHFGFITVLLKVFGMQLQIISIKHLDHVVKSWKNALRTLKHILIKTSSKGFAI